MYAVDFPPFNQILISFTFTLGAEYGKISLFTEYGMICPLRGYTLLPYTVTPHIDAEQKGGMAALPGGRFGRR
jgi:hypothetical protein